MQAPKMYLFLSLTVSLTALTTSEAFAQACSPSYTVTQQACLPTGQNLGFERKTENAIRVNSGACEPDAGSLCREANQNGTLLQELINRGNPQVSEIRVERAYEEDAIGKFCKILKPKKDVYCNVSFDSPVQELIPGEDCPVVSIAEVNRCYVDPNHVEISPKAIQGCLEIRPSTVREWWLKSHCLIDAYQAQNDQRDVSAAVDLNQRIENALRTIRNSQKMSDPNLAPLRAQIDQVLPQ